MKLSFEVETNPGPSSWFRAELQIEAGPRIYSHSGWWAAWFGWWLFNLKTRKLWKDWLFHLSNTNANGWTTFKVCIVGIEFNWQTYDKAKDSFYEDLRPTTN